MDKSSVALTGGVVLILGVLSMAWGVVVVALVVASVAIGRFVEKRRPRLWTPYASAYPEPWEEFPQRDTPPAVLPQHACGVVLISVASNPRKVPVRRALRHLLNMDLTDAYEAVENPPCVLARALASQDAERMRAALQSEGAVVELQQSQTEEKQQ